LFAIEINSLNCCIDLEGEVYDERFYSFLE
jgi:hypothetical protein